MCISRAVVINDEHGHPIRCLKLCGQQELRNPATGLQEKDPAFRAVRLDNAPYTQALLLGKQLGLFGGFKLWSLS